MRTETKRRFASWACLLCLLVTPVLAAEGDTETGWNGVVTPKFYLFNYGGGPGEGYTHFLGRYQVIDAFGSGDDSGFYADADLRLVFATAERDLFVLERRGDGKYSQSTTGRFDMEKVAITGYYSRYRSATGGIDYLYSPNLAPGGTDPSYNTPPQTNSGYFARFNEDFDRTTFDSDRSNFGAGFRLKPALLGNRAAVELRYDGYQRDGNRLTPWIAGGSDFAGAQVQLQRWRGFDQPIDESMGRMSLNASLSPNGWFQLVYDGAVEKFDNQARSFTMGDFASFLPPANSVGGTNGTKPLAFVPDSKLTTHALRFSKTTGRMAVNAGYSVGLLEQETFTQRHLAAGYDTGEIATENGFFNLGAQLSKAVTLEGSLTYSTRDNDSTFPAPGILDPANSQQLGVRIDSVDTLGYGLAAVFRPAGSKTTVRAGWKHEETDRDLTFNNGPTGITAVRSFYRADSSSDEVYLKVISRPAKGWTLRFTPSYLWADETGLVIEPEEALRLQLQASYLTPGGMLFGAYYNSSDAKNGNNAVYNALAPSGALGAEIGQRTDNYLQATGVSLTLSPAEKASLSMGLDWVENDFATYYFSTNRRRFEAPTGGITFTTRDRPSWNVETLSFSLSGEWTASELVKFDMGYTRAQSRGGAGGGIAARELDSTVDGSVDSVLESLLVGANFAATDSLGVWTRFLYEDYEDDVYDPMSGSLVTAMAGFSFKF